MNRLKLERGVDMYIPLRDKMVAYKLAISVANSELNWQKHPDKSRHGEMIALVNLPADCWVQKKSKVPNVPLNACVVWNVPKDEYFVIVTTDITKAAREIIKIYALRVEIEEDYRQLKDFWMIKDFKSTKLHLIAFHIVSSLFGYLFFQLYTTFPEGEELSGKSLPVVLKNHKSVAQPYIVVKAECANYDREYECLPLNGPCYMFTIGFVNSSLCKWFQNAVLPLDPELEALFERKLLKACGHCGKKFPVNGNQVYCQVCAEPARKAATAARVRKHRGKM